MSFFSERAVEAIAPESRAADKAGAPYWNPDKLILPNRLMAEVRDTKATITGNPLDALERKQLFRIESYKMLFLPRADRFEGEKGNSLALPDERMLTGPAAKKWLDAHGLRGIEYKNGSPDFSGIAIESVTIPNMTADSQNNFKQAYRATAEKWNREAKDGRNDWNPSEVKKWAKDNGLTIHEKEDLKTCEFVPTAVHAHFKHLGGKTIAAIVGRFSDRQIAAGIAVRSDFYDQFDA